MEREAEAPPQIGVQTLQIGIGVGQGKPRFEALEADVILLVHHHPHSPIGEQGRPGADLPLALQARQFAGNEMPLVEELALHRLQPVDPNEAGILELARGLRGRFHLLQDHLAFPGIGPDGEPPVGDVSGQPHPGGQDDVAVRATGVEPRYPTVR